MSVSVVVVDDDDDRGGGDGFVSFELDFVLLPLQHLWPLSEPLQP